jgi:two-component system, chemotaxis family, CheB/CheR fusion protein
MDRVMKDEHSGPMASAQDITERKLVEEALRASEIRYRRLFESAKDGILILNAETGMVVDVNPFLVDLLGMSHDAFLGKKIWELGFFKDIVANQDKFTELRQKEYIRYDDKALEASDGRRIEVEFVSNVYLVNHHKVVQCNIRDMTERKRAAAAVRRSEENYRALVRTAQDGFWLLDAHGRFLDVNLAYCNLTGYSRERLLAMRIPDLEAAESPEQVQR